MPVPTPPGVLEADGLVWLMQHMQGYTIRKIALMAHKGTRTVSKAMASAASKLVVEAHSTIMSDLFPLAAKVMQQHLQNQLDKAIKGEAPDLVLAERVMNAMYVFDAPQLKEELTPESVSGEQEIDSIGMMVAKMRERSEEKAIPAAPKTKQLATTPVVEGEVSHGNEDDTK